jgi:hypothetical protein
MFANQWSYSNSTRYSLLSGKQLNAYLACGVRNCHEKSSSRHQFDRSGTTFLGSDAKNKTIQTQRRTTSLYKNSPVRFHAIGSVDTAPFDDTGCREEKRPRNRKRTVERLAGFDLPPHKVNAAPTPRTGFPPIRDSTSGMRLAADPGLA